MGEGEGSLELISSMAEILDLSWFTGLFELDKATVETYEQ
jgi:hypothetical protein